jgi:hypothetical protein
MVAKDIVAGFHRRRRDFGETKPREPCHAVVEHHGGVTVLAAHHGRQTLNQQVYLVQRIPPLIRDARRQGFVPSILAQGTAI